MPGRFQLLMRPEPDKLFGYAPRRRLPAIA